jgi:hypothetical protein
MIIIIVTAVETSNLTKISPLFKKVAVTEKAGHNRNQSAPSVRRVKILHELLMQICVSNEIYSIKRLGHAKQT